MKLLLADAKLFLILILISLAVFTLDQLHFLSFPKSVVQILTAPIQYGLYKTGQGVANQWSIIGSIKTAALENRALQRQMNQLLEENAELRKNLAETTALVDQQNSLSPKTYDLLAARPIGLSRYLTIDKGSDDGVMVGQPVVFKDQYIGQVKSVTSKTSQVMLATDPDSKVAVFAQNTTGKARGILQGQFGSDSLMDKILHEEPIAVDDLVYSDGTEGKLPKGLIVGRVTKVLDRPNEVFKQAQVKPIFNILDLDLVFVMKG